MVEFHLLRPWWLLALLPALLLLVLLVRNKQNRGNWAEVCDVELLPFILDKKPREKRRGGLIAGSLVSILTIIALAGPTWQRLPSPAFRNEAALVIALDLSASMDAADIKPSRLAKARYKIADLLKQRKEGQTGLLVYGGDAFTVTPLTGDTATIISQLEALNTDIMPSPGANVGTAIRKAVDLLRQAGVAEGHILLVCDGVDPDSAALADEWLGVYRLSVLAIGTTEGAPIQQAGSGFVKNSKGDIVIAKLDAAALAELAQNGKGVYQAVTAGDEDIDKLSRVFNNTGGEEHNQQANLLLQQWDEKGPWLLFLVIPWAAMRFRKGLLFWCALCLIPMPRDSLAFDWQSLWQNSNQRAEQAFKHQQYQQAAEQFQNPDWRAVAQYKAGQYQQAAETINNPKTADEFYNRGNALAQAGQLQESLDAYRQALKLDPEHQDAQYNKDIVEKKLQDQQKQQAKDQQNTGQPSQDQKQQDQQSDQPKEQTSQKEQQKQPEQNQSDQNQPAEQDKQSQQNAEQQAKDQKPPSSDDKKQADAGQQQKPDSGKDGQAAQAQPLSETEKDETQRANEQLLKRIPDEPTGLLKRKFKYQYSQRSKAAPTAP